MSITTMMLAAASAAPAFDAEAATQAYLATLQGAARAKSDNYFEGGYWLPLWGALVSLLAYWLMLRFRWSAAWSGWAGRVTRRRWLRPALYSLPFALLGALLTLPWTIYVSYFREHKYGLSNQSLGEWAKELAIANGVGLVVGAISVLRPSVGPHPGTDGDGVEGAPPRRTAARAARDDRHGAGQAGALIKRRRGLRRRAAGGANIMQAPSRRWPAPRRPRRAGSN